MPKKKKLLKKSNVSIKKVDTKSKPKKLTKAGIIRKWITNNPTGSFAQCVNDCGTKVSKPYFYNLKHKMKTSKNPVLQPKKSTKYSKELLEPTRGYAHWWLEGQVYGYVKKMFADIFNQI